MMSHILSARHGKISDAELRGDMDQLRRPETMIGAAVTRRRPVSRSEESSDILLRIRTRSPTNTSLSRQHGTVWRPRGNCGDAPPQVEKCSSMNTALARYASIFS